VINVSVAVPLIPLIRGVTHCHHHHLVSVLASEREPAFPLHPEVNLPRQCSRCRHQAIRRQCYHRVRLVLVLNRLRRCRELVGPALYRLRRRRELVGSDLYRLRRRRRELVGSVSDEEELQLGHGHRLEDLFAPPEWY